MSKKSRGLLCKGVRVRYDFIRRYKKAWPISIPCKILEVSRSGYYNYLHSEEAPEKARARQVLEEATRRIFAHSKETYGSRRMLQGLASEGYPCGRYKVRSLMKALNLHAVVPKRYKVTTNSAHGYPTAPNLLMRKFSVPSPDMVWTADITYIWTLEGWLYLGVVMDLFSRQILGWAAENHMRTDLPLQALHMAWHRRKPSPGLIHHPDRGVQYACR